MKKNCIVFSILVCLFLLLTGNVFAEEKATPQDVYEWVFKAANMVEKLGKEGIDALSTTKEFHFKDSYVWAFDCGKGVCVAHPNPKYIGLKTNEVYDKNPDPAKRRLFLVDLCEGAQKPYGAWVEYYWEKVGETQPQRKISFMVKVPGQPYMVTAGIYDDKTSIDELNKTMLK